MKIGMEYSLIRGFFKFPIEFNNGLVKLDNLNVTAFGFFIEFLIYKVWNYIGICSQIYHVIMNIPIENFECHEEWRSIRGSILFGEGAIDTRVFLCICFS